MAYGRLTDKETEMFERYLEISRMNPKLNPEIIERLIHLLKSEQVSRQDYKRN
ncbi:MAG: hypothetical protein AABX29_00520 [Nanoarchaeota archaeon]